MLVELVAVEVFADSRIGCCCDLVSTEFDLSDLELVHVVKLGSGLLAAEEDFACSHFRWIADFAFVSDEIAQPSAIAELREVLFVAAFLPGPQKLGVVELAASHSPAQLYWAKFFVHAQRGCRADYESEVVELAVSEFLDVVKHLVVEIVVVAELGQQHFASADLVVAQVFVYLSLGYILDFAFVELYGVTNFLVKQVVAAAKLGKSEFLVDFLAFVHVEQIEVASDVFALVAFHNDWRIAAVLDYVVLKYPELLHRRLFFFLLPIPKPFGIYLSVVYTKTL